MWIVLSLYSFISLLTSFPFALILSFNFFYSAHIFHLSLSKIFRCFSYLHILQFDNRKDVVSFYYTLTFFNIALFCWINMILIFFWYLLLSTFYINCNFINSFLVIASCCININKKAVMNVFVYANFNNNLDNFKPITCWSIIILPRLTNIYKNCIFH